MKEFDLTIETFIMRIIHDMLSRDDNITVLDYFKAVDFYSNRDDNITKNHISYIVNDMCFTFVTNNLDDYLLINVDNIDQASYTRDFIMDAIITKKRFGFLEVEPDTLIDLIAAKWDTCHYNCGCRTCSKQPCQLDCCVFECLKTDSIPRPCANRKQKVISISKQMLEKFYLSDEEICDE